MPIGAEGENFLNFGPFLTIYYRFFSFTWPEWGPRVPTLNTLLDSNIQKFLQEWRFCPRAPQRSKFSQKIRFQRKNRRYDLGGLLTTIFCTKCG